MSTDAPPVLWEPSAERAQRTTMWRFLQAHGFDDYDTAWRWSVAEPDAFWQAVSAFFDVRWDVAPDRFLADAQMPGAVWCPGSRVSYAEHVFRDREAAAPAIHHASEVRELATLSWGELTELTARIAAALRREGVGPGDRVVAYMPNVPEAVAALLACAAIGATWSSCSPDFGPSAVVDRFAQIEPTVLLAVDGYRYGGRDFDRRDVVAALRARCRASSGPCCSATSTRTATLEGTVGWEAWLGDASARAGVHAAAVRPPAVGPVLERHHGAAKAIVHGQGGSCSSSCASSGCTPTRSPATASCGSPPRAG
jgi:acetoacetyl-CoA synthetase